MTAVIMAVEWRPIVTLAFYFITSDGKVHVKSRVVRKVALEKVLGTVKHRRFDSGSRCKTEIVILPCWLAPTLRNIIPLFEPTHFDIQDSLIAGHVFRHCE